jgi:hypothetical protein
MLRPGLKHNLIHITVERFVGQIREFFDGAPVIVLLVRPLAEAVVFGVFPAEDARSAFRCR